MPFLKWCMKPRNFYVPDERIADDHSSTAIKGPFELNRRQTLRTGSSVNPSSHHTISSSASASDHLPIAATSHRASSRGPPVNSRSSSHREAPIIDPTLNKSVSSQSVVPMAISAESIKSIPAPPAKSQSKSLSRGISKLLSQSKSLPMDEHVKSPSIEAADQVELDESSPSGKRVAPLAPPSVHREASVNPIPKPKAKSKAKAKTGLRSGNQIVKNAVSDSPTGLRTKDHTKMVEMMDPKDKNMNVWTANFLRHTIDIDPQQEIVNHREGAVLIYLLLYAAKIDNAGGINCSASVIQHLSVLACGDPALATPKAKQGGPKVAFIAGKIYRPLIDAIVEGTAGQKDGSKWLDDIREDVKFSLGTKPNFLDERIEWIAEFMSGSYLGMSKITSFATFKDIMQRDKSAAEKVASLFDTCKAGGDFKSIFSQL